MIVRMLFSILPNGATFMMENQNDSRLLRKVEIRPGNTGSYMLATRPIRGFIDDGTNCVELTGSDFLVLTEVEDV